jgi:hypothetical protein
MQEREAKQRDLDTIKIENEKKVSRLKAHVASVKDLLGIKICKQNDWQFKIVFKGLAS